MDVFPQIIIPDITIQTIMLSEVGSIIFVSREGGFMVCFYTELHPETIAKYVNA